MREEELEKIETVFRYVYEHTDKHGHWRGCGAYISDEHGIPLRTVYSILEVLENSGLVTKLGNRLYVVEPLVEEQKKNEPLWKPDATTRYYR